MHPLHMRISGICLAIVLLGLMACTKEINDSQAATDIVAEVEVETTDMEESVPPPASTNLDLTALPNASARTAVPILAEEVIQALKSKNLRRLAKLSHPEKGIKFSPEVSVEPSHRVLKAKDLREIMKDPTEYTWGTADGIGGNISATFADYYDRYLYDVDFAATDSIFYNQAQQHGNAINNAPRAYPGCVVVEYYVPGTDPAYAGMDWRALRLVFEPFEDEWYLVGLIHAAWTT